MSTEQLTQTLTGQDEITHELLNASAVNGKYSLSKAQVIEIFRLRRLNADATQRQIAAAVGCSEASVSRWLSAVGTDEDAENLLAANSLPAALVVADKLNSQDERIQMDAAKTVLKARKLLDQDTNIRVGVQVVLGVPSSAQVIDSKGIVE